MKIREKLANVDKKVWVGIGCAVVGILYMSFFVFNSFGRSIITYIGYCFLFLLTFVVLLKVYFMILKKLGLVEEDPISINFDVDIKKPVYINKRNEANESDVPEGTKDEVEIPMEDEES